MSFLNKFVDPKLS